jgi:hypothetical protein
MTTTTGNSHTRGPAGPGHARHVLVRDDQDRLILRRLRPWHRILARCAAARLDRELAAGASPEASASLAARAIQLTSMEFRRDLARTLRRILVAATGPAAVMPSPAAVIRPPRLLLPRARISQSAVPLAALADYLVAPGPVPAQGVAIVSQLLCDGAGPLYHQASIDDLADIIEKAMRALSGAS